VLETLNSPRFVDHAPAEVYARLLDEGTYLCSIRTMYRLLDQQDEVASGATSSSIRSTTSRNCWPRRPTRSGRGTSPSCSAGKMELLPPVRGARHLQPLRGGLALAHRECASLARRLIGESCQKQQIDPGQLTIHSDRGAPMKSQTVSQLLATLGVVRSLSRPHVSNDNPFSESQFKTLKYQGGFPDRFESFDVALAFCRSSSPGTTTSTITAAWAC